MTPRVAAELARQLEVMARDIYAIKPLCRRQPHIFTEQKDELRRRCQTMARLVRQSQTACKPAETSPARAIAERVFSRS